METPRWRGEAEALLEISFWLEAHVTASRPSQPGKCDAERALGLTCPDLMSLVIMPQALGLAVWCGS